MTSKNKLKITNPDKLWFTSDPHFNHANIIKYCNRPFTNVNEMNELLISNWNSVVKEDDIIVCGGDFSWGSPKDCQNILEQLNGQKVLVIGNHEKSVMESAKNRDLFTLGLFDILNITVMDEEVSDEFQDIVVCHYPMITWDKSHRGSWQLFGHVHGMLDDNSALSPNQFDIGVDSHNFMPISYQEVKEIITRRNLERIKNGKR